MFIDLMVELVLPTAILSFKLQNIVGLALEYQLGLL